MATVDDVLDEQETLIEEQLDDDQFLSDLFEMQAYLEQRRKETLDSWIEFLGRFDPTFAKEPEPDFDAEEDEREEELPETD